MRSAKAGGIIGLARVEFINIAIKGAFFFGVVFIRNLDLFIWKVGVLSLALIGKVAKVARLGMIDVGRRRCAKVRGRWCLQLGKSSKPRLNLSTCCANSVSTMRMIVYLVCAGSVTSTTHNIIHDWYEWLAVLALPWHHGARLAERMPRKQSARSFRFKRGFHVHNLEPQKPL